MNWQNLPQELKDRHQWLVAGSDKSPRNCEGKNVGVTDPNSWVDFDTACQAAIRLDMGIGYCLSDEDPFTCIDLDIKETTTAEQKERHQKIIDGFDTYTERSTSGNGYHLWCKGRVEGGGRRRDGVEVYSKARFMVCTGDVVLNKSIEERSEILNILVNEISLQDSSSVIEPMPDMPQREDDAVILKRAFSAENGAKFQALFNADWETIGHQDHSKADMALLSILAVYTPNSDQLKRLFLSSELGKRDKATKRKDYLDRTILEVRKNQAAGPNSFHGEEIAQGLLNSFDNAISVISLSSYTTGQKLSIYSVSEFIQRPIMKWIVKGVIPEESVCMIFGPSGSGKSFLSIDLSFHIALGRPWFGRTSVKTPVVYVAFEGGAGLTQRIKVYEREFGDVECLKIILTQSLNLSNPSDRQILITALKEQGYKNGLLCIDTLAASSYGVDENSVKEMGPLINGLNHIRDSLGGSILIVHHTGKNGEAGPRGSSAILAAMDACIKVESNVAGSSWSTSKSKDSSGDIMEGFRLEQRELGEDEDGDPVTSCLVRPDKRAAINREADKVIVLNLIKEFYNSGDYISTKANSPDSAFRKLRNEERFPRSSFKSSSQLNAFLEELVVEGRLDKEGYNGDNRHPKERWKVV